MNLFSMYSVPNYVPPVSSEGSVRAESRANEAQRDVRALEEQLAKTLMICEALWELLSEQTNLTQEHLYKKLYEIDMRDGKLDGKNDAKVMECPNCGRKVTTRRETCLYCGQVLNKSVFQL